MTDALSMLQSISGFVQAQRDSPADRPCLLGVIDPAYAGLPNLPKVTFEGESTLSGKTYAHLASYVPVAGDRVALMPVGTTYLIVGPVAATPAAVSVQGASANVAGNVVAGGLVLPAGSVLDVGAWQTYTPAWTASTTNPAVGNGTMTGRYIYLNKHTVMMVIRIVCGSTSTKGSGNYKLSVPVAAADSLGFGVVGSFAINDSGSALREGSCVFTSTTTIEMWLNGTGGALSSSSLLGTFTTSSFYLAITYEV